MSRTMPAMTVFLGDVKMAPMFELPYLVGGIGEYPINLL